MKKLSGASSLKRQVLNKWNFKIRRTSKWKARRYLVEFPCPVCHGYSVYEDFKEKRYGRFGEYWSISWWSKCGHMDGLVTYPAESRLREISVTKNGETVGVIVPFHRPLGRGGPLWERYESTEEAPPPARFGTVWQALKASAFECELLALMQGGEA